MTSKVHKFLNENSLLFLLFFLIYLGLGAYLIFVKDLMPQDSMARLVKAYLVFYGNESKLATIGFVWPPIPTLIMLAVAWNEYLVFTTLGYVIVSASFMAISCVLLSSFLKRYNTPRFWRYLMILLYAANPLIIVHAVNGYSESIAITFTLLAFFRLITFWESDRNSHLVLSAFLFSFLPLIRFELAMITAVGGAMVLLISWLKRGKIEVEQQRNFFEGRVLAYSAMAIYPLFLWTFINWLIMDNPLYFLFDARSAINLMGDSPGSGIEAFDFFRTLFQSFAFWFEVFPIGLFVSMLAIFLGIRFRSFFYTGLGMFPLAIPLFQGLFHRGGSIVSNPRYFILVIPFTFPVFIVTLNEFQGKFRLSTKRKNILLGLFSLFVLLSNISTARLLPENSSTTRTTWMALTTEQSGSRKAITDAIEVGKVLSDFVPQNAKILFDDYGYGFAIHLGLQNPKLFLDHTHPNYRDALKNPSSYVDYILIPEPKGRGWLNDINRLHPSLYHGDGLWVERIDGLPNSEEGWRLFKILYPTKGL